MALSKPSVKVVLRRLNSIPSRMHHTAPDESDNGLVTPPPHADQADRPVPNMLEMLTDLTMLGVDVQQMMAPARDKMAAYCAEHGFGHAVCDALLKFQAFAGGNGIQSSGVKDEEARVAALRLLAVAGVVESGRAADAARLEVQQGVPEGCLSARAARPARRAACGIQRAGGALFAPLASCPLRAYRRRRWARDSGRRRDSASGPEGAPGEQLADGRVVPDGLTGRHAFRQGHQRDL